MITSTVVDTNFGLAVIAAMDVQARYGRIDHNLHAFSIERAPEEWSFQFVVVEGTANHYVAGSNFRVSGNSAGQWRVIPKPSRNQGDSDDEAPEWTDNLCRQVRESVKNVQRLAVDEPLAIKLAIKRTLEALPREDIGEALILRLEPESRSASLSLLRSHIDIGLSIEELRGRQYLRWDCSYHGSGIIDIFPINSNLDDVGLQINALLARAKRFRGQSTGTCCCDPAMLMRRNAPAGSSGHARRGPAV